MIEARCLSDFLSCHHFKRSFPARSKCQFEWNMSRERSSDFSTENEHRRRIFTHDFAHSSAMNLAVCEVFGDGVNPSDRAAKIFRTKHTRPTSDGLSRDPDYGLPRQRAFPVGELTCPGSEGLTLNSVEPFTSYSAYSHVRC
jgi:hypothetical protein